MKMKKNAFSAIDVFFEALYFLVITYVLFCMTASFRPHWYSLIFQVANIFTIIKFLDSLKSKMKRPLWAYVILFSSLLVFALIIPKIGYIQGTLTPFIYR